ncbi:MAG: SAM-dependent chlorinase/fluorinase [Actinomycetota bacterium]
MGTYRFVTFLSDFGAEGSFVGVCRGVILRIAPEVTVVDVTHAIAPQDVRQGALVLAQSVPFLPEAVHLAVVDPAVGTHRRAIAVATGSGSVLVGPDNGLLCFAWDCLGGAERAVELTNESYRLTPTARTFHGRDLFSPAAAHLALGVALKDLGRSVDPASLVRLEEPASRVDGDHVHGEVLLVDHFGNLQLSVGRAELEIAGIFMGDQIELRAGGRTHTACFCETFSEVAVGDLLVYEDSYRRLAVAVNRGNASHVLGAVCAESVILARLHHR